MVTSDEPAISVAAALAARIRGLLADRDGITERKMFGCHCFMLDGNMLVCAMKAGELLVRVSPEAEAEALMQPGVATRLMGTREMTGFVGVSGPAIDEDAAIARWIAVAERHVRTLPPK